MLRFENARSQKRSKACLAGFQAALVNASETAFPNQIGLSKVSCGCGELAEREATSHVDLLAANFLALITNERIRSAQTLCTESGVEVKPTKNAKKKQTEQKQIREFCNLTFAIIDEWLPPPARCKSKR